ncbi:MAG TPA: glycosyltransferase [Fuerstia sp.]|nr:glycosyltransferase [Fuerstiella sp.]
MDALLLYGREFQSAADNSRAMPEVSVMMPVLSAETTIACAVDLMLQQTSVDLELIVVDDGSNDKTVPALESVHDGRLIFRPIHLRP